MNVVDIAEFYASALGKSVQHFLTERLRFSAKPDQLVMGLGYALPYMKPTDRQVAFMLARSGVIQWPDQQPARSALVDELDLPLSESVVDVAVLVHALEFSESPEDMLEEVCRVLSPQGKLLLVVPNRRGLWSSSDKSPFGHGQPFSRPQILSLLKAAQFTVQRIEHGLLLPPSRRLASSLNIIGSLEKLAGLALRRMSGVIVIEATKQVYAYSTGKLARRRLPRLRPVLLPAPQAATKS